ncbi:MAG: extracellular solute-binding protein [Bacilli bacterium]|jgi:arabinogalactan oligomer/maltooligosaccharide transport system substrate-binding protein
MKRKLWLLLALVPMMALGACSRGSSEGEGATLTLTIWEDNKNIEMVTAMTTEFARYYAYNYPNAPKLEFEIVPHSEKSSIEDLVLDGPAGIGPDVVAFVHDTLGVAVGGNHLAVNSLTEKIKNVHQPDAYQAASLNGITYGYPITSESQVLIYRKSAISTLQAQNIETIIEPDGANAKLVWDVLEGYYSFALLNDAVLYGADGETTIGDKSTYLDFSTPQAVSNVAYMHENYKDNANLVIPGLQSGSTDIEGLNMFLAGDVQGIVVAPYFWAAAKEAFGSDVAMAPLPKVDGETLRPFSGYKLYGVSRYSKNPALAQELADFLTNDWSQAMRLRDKTLLPTWTSLVAQLDQNSIEVAHWRNLEALKITVDTAILQEASVFEASLQTSITMPKIERFSAFWVAYANNMTALWQEDELTTGEIEDYLDAMTTNM